jgi:WD40 repeat protein
MPSGRRWVYFAALGVALSMPRPVQADGPDNALPRGVIARLGPARLRHPDAVLHLVFSGDSKQLLSVGAGGKPALLWEVASGRLEQQIVLEASSRCVALAASADGKYLVLYGDAEEAVLVDRETGAQLQRWAPAGKDGAFAEMAFDADGTSLMTLAMDGTIARYAVPQGRRFGQYQSTGKQFPRGALSPDGRWLVGRTGAPKPADSLPRLWNAGTGQAAAALGGAPATCGEFVWSPDGRHVASISDRKVVLVWEVAKGQQLCRVREGAAAERLALAADGKAVAWICRGKEPAVVLAEVPGGKIRWRWPMPGADSTMTFSPDGKVLAIGTRGGTIYLLNAGSGQLLPACARRGEFAEPIAFLPDGRSLIATCDEEVVRTEVATGRVLARFGSGSSWQLSPDGRHLAFFNGPGKVLRLFDTATGRLRWQKPAALGRLQFSQDGHLLAVLSAGGERCFASAGGEPVSLSWADALAPRGVTLALSDDFRWRIQPSPDGGELQTRNVSTGVVRQRWTAPQEHLWSSAFLAPGGQAQVAAAGPSWHLQDSVRGGTWRRWERDQAGGFTSDGRHLLLRRGPTATILYDVQRNREALFFYDAPVTAAAPDGRTLAASDGAAIELWDMALRRHIRTLEGSPTGIDHLAFSRDGRTLAATGGGSVLLWDVTGLASAPGRLPALDLKAADIEHLWTDLAGSDADLAHRAFWKLAALGEQTFKFLRPRIQAQPDLGSQARAKLVADLESDSYAVRAKATRQLETLDETRSMLLDALAKKIPLETRKRIELVLSKQQEWLDSADLRLQLRMVDLLEQLGSQEARAALEELAAGAAEATLTQAAARALRRM